MNQRSESVLTVASTASNKSFEANLGIVLKVSSHHSPLSLQQGTDREKMVNRKCTIQSVLNQSINRLLPLRSTSLCLQINPDPLSPSHRVTVPTQPGPHQQEEE